MLTVPKPKTFKLGAAGLANHIPMGWAENLRLSKIRNNLFMCRIHCHVHDKTTFISR
jgi:hypothetical protein